MSFVDRVSEHGGRKAPVQATVRERWTDIENARTAGHRLAAIRRTLAAEGYEVGKGPSSFNAAVRAVRKEKAEQMTPSIAASRQNDLADNRFTSDY